MSMFRVGDFFLLEDLCTLALHWADRTFRGISWAFLTTEETDLSKQSATDNIVKLVRALYTQEQRHLYDAFKPSILAFLISGTHILKENAVFKDLLYEIPAFASDWAVTLTDNMTRPFSRPEHCAKCTASWSRRSNLNFSNWIKGRKVEAFCDKCYPFQPLEDWIGEDSGNT